jgi:eukaryotic-like serine/threonine-protein kinase
MAHDRRCPRCGKLLPPDVKSGICPACLLRAGLEPGSEAAPLDGSNDVEVTVGFESISPGQVLETLARSIGSIPRILLPDTRQDDQGVAVIKPSSLEMPAPADRGPRYQLFGEIARGGMGAILKGRDPDLGRDLAVKVLLEGHRDKPELLRRFVEEAQISGQLQHPGIVPVYELGTFADSRPYFTMKLVKGRTLAALLRERPVPHHDRARFLGIFEQVCQTVAYAHARGVIHRDLKPSNIMVGSFGEVQVMDWGLAKVLKEGGAADEAPAPDTPAPEVSVIQTVRSGSDVDDSQAGSVLGTPAYMATEQAGGDVERVDRRADVFGLGSILCEILTGRPAYTGHTQAELVRKAMRGDMGEALARLDGCGAEAELIALAKDCLAAEADDRPRDAGVVAGRVSAYLAGVQERVRQAELARAQADARAEEERKRRKLALALAAAVVALMAVGGGGAAAYFRQREAEAARLSVALHDVEMLRDQARLDPMGDPDRWRAALVAAERATDLLGPMVDARSSRRVRALREEVRQAAVSADSDAKLMQAAVDILSARADDPDGSIGDAAYAAAFRQDGLDVDAMAPEAVGARIRARPSGVALALAAALDDWAGRRRNARPKDEAAWRRPIDAARAADPDDTRDRLRELWSRSDAKGQRGSLLDLAKRADPRGWPPTSLLLMARALFAADEGDAAVALLRSAQVHQPGDVWLNYTLASSLEAMKPPRADEAIAYYTAARAMQPETAHELAHLLEARGRGDEAAAVFADLVRLRPGDARHRLCYGRLLKDHGDGAGAAAAMEAAVAALRQAVRLKPDDDQAHANLGSALRSQGKVAEAVDEYRAALRLGPDNALTRINLGDALRGQGKVDEAIDEYRAALRLEPGAPMTHLSLGGILCDVKHDFAGAEAEFRTALRLQPDLAEAHGNLGSALRGQGKIAEAIAEYRTALRLRPDLTMALFNLADILQCQGKMNEAIDVYRQAIRHRPNLDWPHLSLGAILCDVKRDYAGAEAEFRTAIRLQPDFAVAHGDLGNALYGQGKLDEALAAYREAIRLQPESSEVHVRLGTALHAQGKLAEAEAAFRKAVELKPDDHFNHDWLGYVLMVGGRNEAAIPEFRRAIELKPDYLKAYRNLAAALKKLGRTNEAIAAHREMIRIKPKDGAEGLALAETAYQLKRYGAGAGLYAGAFASNPGLAEDMTSGNRYNAACTAALAAAGRGEDPLTDGAEKARWRKQAVEWLTADLAAWTGRIQASKPENRALAARTLQHWKEDADLAGIREPGAPAELLAEEQAACRKLWSEVDALLARAGGRTP